MLGNWSFGDYADEAACHMALDLLVNHYKLPISKLYITYFGGGEGLSPDLRVKDIWISLGIPENQIVRGHVNFSNLDKMRTDNFWAMGSSGTCCHMLFYPMKKFTAFFLCACSCVILRSLNFSCPNNLSNRSKFKCFNHFNRGLLFHCSRKFLPKILS